MAQSIREERRVVTVKSDSNFFDPALQKVGGGVDKMSQEMNEIRSGMMRLTPAKSTASPALQGLMDPIVTLPDGSQKLRLRLDIQDFKPEEIVVKTTGNEIIVEAHREEKTDRGTVNKQLSRKFTVPESVNLKEVTSSVSQDGVMSIEAPINAPPGHYIEEITIQRK